MPEDRRTLYIRKRGQIEPAEVETRRATLNIPTQAPEPVAATFSPEPAFSPGSVPISGHAQIVASYSESPNSDATAVDVPRLRIQALAEENAVLAQLAIPPTGFPPPSYA
jgi:hypothetical protein